jgi:hypothetical protein
VTLDSAPILIVADIGALAPTLRACNVVVPERAAGRTKDHVERYSITRLLGTLSWAPEDFPLRLVKRERPDFVLECNERTIGIEHVETLTPNAGSEAFLRSKGHGPEAYFPRPMVLGEARKSRRQLIEEIEADEMGTGWYGDSVERSWVEAMLHFIRTKIEVARKNGFQLFRQNWLLMYDNWHAPALNREKAVVRLRQELELDPPWSTFERVFILDDLVLVDLEQGSVRLSLMRDPGT